MKRVERGVIGEITLMFRVLLFVWGVDEVDMNVGMMHGLEYEE